MSNTVTLTFSPCIDKSFSAPELIPSKKIYCSAPHFNAGGGGVNVARALQRLGNNTTAVFTSGGTMGQLLEALLVDQGVAIVPVNTTTNTRENIMITENASGYHYQFIMPPPVLTADEYAGIITALNEVQAPVGYIVVSGSMPVDFPPDIFERIAQCALRKNARLVVDTSGRALVSALEAGVYLAKPNLNELALLTGKTSLSGAEIEGAAKWVLAKYKCTVIIVSLGRDGAMLVTEDRTAIFKAPDPKVKSTTGAGDSMVAGIIHSLLLQKSLEEALKFGVACGTAATLNEGTELCHAADAEGFYRQVIQIR